MNRVTATTPQRALADALLDSGAPLPAGLRAWNGSDPGRRWDVHRNNVMGSLVDVLAETFPVVARLVGPAFFSAMAACHVRAQPPASPVMSGYGDGFAGWLIGFEPAAALPYLADMARLEYARVRAFHAADATPLGVQGLSEAWAQPELLPRWRLHLCPSLSVVISSWAVVSLWSAHQEADEAAIAKVDLRRAEAAVVLRQDDEVLVLPLPCAEARLVEQLQHGAPLAAATAAAPDADLAAVLAMLLRHGALVDNAATVPAAAPCGGRP